MKNIIIYFSLFIFFLFVGLSPVYAGFEEGLAAYERDDYEIALQEFKPLAEQGNAKAQYSLGLMYDYGHGVPQDYAEAIKWFTKAAEQGHALSQVFLGVMYYNAQGVTQDIVMSYMWLNLAVAQGYDGASTLRSILEREMTLEQIAEAWRLSRELELKKP